MANTVSTHQLLTNPSFGNVEKTPVAILCIPPEFTTPNLGIPTNFLRGTETQFACFFCTKIDKFFFRDPRGFISHAKNQICRIFFQGNRFLYGGSMSD